MEGLSEAENWRDYPKDSNDGEDMQEDHLSPALVGSPPQQYLSSIVATATDITPFASFFEKINKRDFLESMDVDEEDIVRKPKNLKVEKPRQLV